MEVGRFVEVCRRGLKSVRIYIYRLECEVYVEEICLEQV